MDTPQKKNADNDISEQTERVVEAAQSAFNEELSEETKADIAQTFDVFKSEYFLEAFTELLPVCFFAKDTNLRYVYVNDAFWKSTSKETREEIIGKRSSDVFSEERGFIAEQQDKTILDSGQAILNQEICNTDAQLEDSYVLVSKVCVKDCDGTIIGLAGVFFDITQRKRDEVKLQELNEKLEERNQQLEDDLSLAREVQKAFLTTKLSDWSEEYLKFGYVHKPSEKLGGDLFLFEQLDANTCAFFVCDVMGHGIRAALITGLIRGLYDELKDCVTSPDFFITQFNNSYQDLLYSLKETIFVTVLQGVIDLSSNRVMMTCAGHHDPLWYKKDEDVFHDTNLRLVEPGPAIGLMKDYEYEKSTFHIKNGDSLLFFTDGLSECGAPEKDEFGYSRIKESFLVRKNEDCQSVVDGIVRDADAYAGHIDDDLCLLHLSIPE